MARKTANSIKAGKADAKAITKDCAGKRPKSLAIANRGVNTGTQFASLMSALIGDVLSGDIGSGTCNAAVNAGGKLLKVVEMQIKYGTADGKGNGNQKTLTLTAQ